MPSFAAPAAVLPCRSRRRAAILALCLFVLPVVARAAIIRGHVRDTLGRAVPGARVQLIFGQTTATFALTGPDGSFEIRDGDSGRFVLLTSAPGFAPQIGTSFFSGVTDTLTQDITLSTSEIRVSTSTLDTNTPLPAAQLAAPLQFLTRDSLSTRIDLVDQLRYSPGTQVVQFGQRGSPAYLSQWAGAPNATLILFDGAPANAIGGLFDLGTLSSTGLAGPGAGNGVDLLRGADSAGQGTGALAGTAALHTAAADQDRPVLLYSGDAGNLHTWRNEAIVSGTLRPLDVLAGISRVDTSNALQHDRFHNVTAITNVGYSITARTPIRLTLRNSDSAVGTPGPYDFYGVAADGKRASQDLFGTVTLENTTLFRWHNLVQYGLIRRREQTLAFAPTGTLLPAVGSGLGRDVYLGRPVTIRGANGYTTSGQAIVVQPTGEQANNRDTVLFQSDLTRWNILRAAFRFRYLNERALFLAPGGGETLNQSNFDTGLALSGTLFGRLSYTAAGSAENNGTFGLRGTPAFGLSFQAIRPGLRWFQGTRLRARAATGVQEPSLPEIYSSLGHQLTRAGSAQPAPIPGLMPTAQRSRTLSFGLDQNIRGDALTLYAGAFAANNSHVAETIGAGTLQRTFGFDATRAGLSGATANSLAYQARGLEAELQYRPRPRILVRAGYTYTLTRVQQSLAASAQAQQLGFAVTNPGLPGIAIGASSPLLGGRIFHQPPHMAFASAAYTGTKFTLAATAAAASRSDDSTSLAGLDRNGGNTLLLPNRDLAFGYTKVDLAATYAASKRIGVFVQAENLANDQHIGPIGYPALPLTARAGIKLRLGGF